MANAFQPDAFQNDAFESSTPLIGAATGSSSAEGALTGGLPVVYVSGTATGTSSGVARLVSQIALRAAANGTSSGLAFERLALHLRGAAAGRAIGLGRISRDLLLQGAVASSSSGIGNLYWGSLVVDPPAPGTPEAIRAEIPFLIVYDAQDITVDVLRQSARFMSAANGAVGTCIFRVRDDGHTYAFTVGKPLYLEIEGQRAWTGYVQSVRRGFFMLDAKSPESRQRYFEIQGVDLNILFQRRVLYNKTDPTAVQLTTFPAGTDDSLIASTYMSQHVDLSGDNLGTSKIEHVGTPATDTEISGSVGWTWGDMMAFITRNTGGLYYIDPDRQVVLTDVDVPNAPYTISDHPASGEVGCRDVEIDFDGSKLRNDVLVWGAGQGSATPVFARVTDAASVTSHGTWQVGEFNQTVWRQATVDRIADSYVNGSPQSKRGGKDDAVAVRCVVYQSGFRVGQKATFRSDVFGYTDVLPIRTMEIDFVANEPRYTLVLSHEIDAPWSTFEFWMPTWTVPEFPGLPGFGFPPFGFPPIGFPPIGFPPFDPCAHTCDDATTPVEGCIDTFTRTVATGIGASELSDGGTYTANARFRVDGQKVVATRGPTGYTGTRTTLTGQTLTAPGCASFDVLWLDETGSNSFQGGLTLILRRGGFTGSTAINNAYSLRLNYQANNGSMILQYAALGDEDTSFVDRGRSATASIADYPADTWVTWQLYYSNDEIRARGVVRDTGAVLYDATLPNSPTPGTTHWKNTNLTQIEWSHVLTPVTGGVAGEDVLYIDNFNICCDGECGGYEPNTIGGLMGLFGGPDVPIDLPLEIAARVSFPNFINEAGRRFAITIGLSDSGIFSSRQNAGIATIEVGQVSPIGFVGADGYIVVNAESGNSFWTFPTKVLSLSSIGSGWFWLKCRIEADTVKARAWADGDPEPVGWQSSTARTSQAAHVISNLTNIIVTGAADITGASQPQVLVDKIVVSVNGVPPEEQETFTRVVANNWGASEMFGQTWTRAEGNAADVSVDGSHGTISNAVTSGATLLLSTVGVSIPATPDPCGEDQSDQPEGPTCETPTNFETYKYRLRSAFEPRSTRVWLNGHLLRRGTDYTENATNGYVEIDHDLHDTITTPEVYVCYHAWNIVVVTA